MTSKQLAELVGRHADGVKDAAQGSLEHVAASVDWDGDRTPVRMVHDVMAAVDSRNSEARALQRLDYPRSRHNRDGARHKAGSYQKSGNVECQGQLIRYPDLFDQQLQTRAQVGDRFLLRHPLAERSDARPELGGSAPAAVLILLDDVGHVN